MHATRRLPPILLGILLVVLGLALLAGGIRLLGLGGSWYYLLAGVGIALSGVLLLLGRRVALGLYGLVLLASTLWALWEVGLDWWQLVPRLALWFVLGVLLLLPWWRRPLHGSAAHAGLLAVAVLAAGATAVASQFTAPHRFAGQLQGEPAAVVAPRPTGVDWLFYGGSQYGDRYSTLTQITPGNVQQLQVA